MHLDHPFKGIRARRQREAHRAIGRGAGHHPGARDAATYRAHAGAARHTAGVTAREVTMPIRVIRTSHASVDVEDTSKSAAFYTDVLGLEEIESQEPDFDVR